MRPSRCDGLALVCAAVLYAGTADAKVTAFSTGRAQGPPAEQIKLPDKPVWLGTVRLPMRVMADGQALPAGSYRVRLTGEFAKSEVVGQAARLERWVEFVQNGNVKGRAMAPVVPAAAARDVAKTAMPGRGAVRAERLKDDDYFRLWFNYQGDQVLVYLPIA